LSDEDLGLILDFAGDPDRTLRIYATEFLYDLDNPRVTEQAIGRAAATDDDSARYNWLFVSQGGWKVLSAEQKEKLQPALATLRQAIGSDNPKALKLIDGFDWPFDPPDLQ